MYKSKKRVNLEHVYLLFITAVAIVSIVGNVAQNHNYDKSEKSYKSEIKSLENKTIYLKDENRDVKINELQNLYEDLKEEYNELYQSNKWTSLGEFKITHYGRDCLGCSGITATGTIPQENRTIATDWNVIPAGTEVSINGIVYIVEDRGSAIQGNVIDVFAGTEENSIKKGIYTTEVYIKEK